MVLPQLWYFSADRLWERGECGEAQSVVWCNMAQLAQYMEASQTRKEPASPAAGRWILATTGLPGASPHPVFYHKESKDRLSQLSCSKYHVFTRKASNMVFKNFWPPEVSPFLCKLTRNSPFNQRSFVLTRNTFIELRTNDGCCRTKGCGGQIG